MFETRFNAQKINFSDMNQNKHFFSNKMLFTDFKVKHTFCHQNRCDEWFWIQQNKILYTLCTYALLQLKIKRLHPKNNSRYCHLRGDFFSPRDNMIDHIWFMVVRNFQEHRRQVTFKLKIKMSDLDMWGCLLF